MAARKNSMALILIAQALSTLGTSVTTVALAVMVFDRTGSVLHMGGILAASTVPVVVVSILGGALVDRYPARGLMVTADVARAVLVLGMPYLAGLSVSYIYVLSAAMGVFTALFNPSQIKMVGELTPPSQLMRANSHLSIARDGAELGGYLVGGALVASLGYFATFAVDALSYGVSALLLLGLPRLPASASGAKLGAMVKEAPRVIASMWGRVPLRVNMLFALIPMAFVMMSTPNAYGLALEVYGRGAQDLALMETVTAAGWIVGGVVAGRLNYRGDRNGYVAVCGLGICLCFIGVSLCGSFWPAVALLTLAAVANVGVIVGSMTIFQEVESRPDKGRIIALRAGLGQFSGAMGLLLGGLLGQAVGIRNVFGLAGLAALLTGGAIWVGYVVWRRRTAPEDQAPELTT